MASKSCVQIQHLKAVILVSMILTLAHMGSEACNVGFGNLGFGNVGIGNIGFGNAGLFNSGRRNIGVFNRLSYKSIGVGNIASRRKIGVAGIGVPNLTPLGKKK